MNTRALAVASLIAAASSAAYAVPTVGYLRGHTDISVDPDGNGGVQFAYFHRNGLEFENLQAEDDAADPNTTYVRVPDSQEIERPPGDIWNFLGADEGETIWFLPQSQNIAVPYLGVGAESLSAAVWQDLTVTFESVEGPDSAAFSLWQSSSGVPNVTIATADGLPTELPLLVGGHTHYNWTFSEPGVYRITLSAVATRVDQTTAEATATFWFAVGSDTELPPTQPPCLGDADGDGFVAAADLLLVLGNFGDTGFEPNTSGDVTGEGDVNAADLLEVLSNVGAACE